MTQDEMNRLVPEKIRDMEEKYNINILWAIESGSRAWGFASPDSDFDIRFIYKRKLKDYLKLKPERDVIELPIDETWDVSGWDLYKALKLLKNANPTLYEWMNSPIKYLNTASSAKFRSQIEPLLTLYFSEKKALYHYLSMAKNNHINHALQMKAVKPKKYFYALRPVLACLWIIEYHAPPPVLFADLIKTVLPENIKPYVEYLLELKINGPEKMEIQPIQEINLFLSDKIEEIKNYLPTAPDAVNSKWDDLNEFFYQEIYN